MARPTDAGSLAEAVYSQLESMQYAEEELDYPLLKFIGALGQMLQDIDELAHSEEVPWSRLLDINRIPDAGVAWLGQFIGVQVDTSRTIEEQKQQIRSHEAWNRGTPEALRDAIRPFLTGTQTIALVERYPNSREFVISTYETETPPDTTYLDYYNDYAAYQDFFDTWVDYGRAWLEIGTNRMVAALLEKKPASLRMEFTVIPGAPPGGSATTYSPIFLDFTRYQDLWNAYETYEDIWVDHLT